ncbi:uncharacterized protein IL334_000701 [Kwoniella shivajii]|uniref:OTU domain-containing protein n=1 Tax=Kwoniella shivajii TaxID=564305 RepID=A0ABZ1CPV8_9TREE|nr:hypothetical protein IL334_000701 [Kwoniella shivajii]
MVQLDLLPGQKRATKLRNLKKRKAKRTKAQAAGVAQSRQIAKVKNSPNISALVHRKGTITKPHLQLSLILPSDNETSLGLPRSKLRAWANDSPSPSKTPKPEAAVPSQDFLPQQAVLDPPSRKSHHNEDCPSSAGRSVEPSHIVTDNQVFLAPSGKQLYDLFSPHPFPELYPHAAHPWEQSDYIPNFAKYAAGLTAAGKAIVEKHHPSTSYENNGQDEAMRTEEEPVSRQEGDGAELSPIEAQKNEAIYYSTRSTAQNGSCMFHALCQGI